MFEVTLLTFKLLSFMGFTVLF